MDWNFLLVSFTGLLAILDPLAVVPVYLALFGDAERRQKKMVASTAAIAVVLTLLFFMTAGAQLLAFLGISLPAFRVAGGIIIFAMALEMLAGGMSRVKRDEGQEDYSDIRSFAIVPLAIPLLSGPGAMSTAILLSQKAPSWADRIGLFVIVLVLGVIVWATLRLAEKAQKIFGKTGIRIATRIMGLLLAALGVQFVASGVLELFPALGVTVK
ncbi:NAAT family transporter [bacterium]|nr:NAAT family transporter [bacterium]